MELRLSTKTGLIVAGLILTAVVGSGLSLLHAWRTQRQANELIADRVANLIAATELDMAMLKQRGYVAAYLLDDGDPEWLLQEDAMDPMVAAGLETLERPPLRPYESALLPQIRESFARYVALRQEVRDLQSRGRSAEARGLYLGRMTSSYREITQTCDELVAHSRDDIRDAVTVIETAMGRLSTLVTAEAILTILLGVSLLWLLYVSVFAPLRRITDQLRVVMTDGTAPPEPGPGDEAHALGYYLQILMTQASSTRSDLEKSSEELAHKRRLAEIGNAVARVAHDIRNAMSCIGGYARMIEKRPEDPRQVRDDAGVIFQTAVRLEQTLQEMMDYSRPAVVETQVQSPNDAVAAALNSVGGQRPNHVTIDAELDPATPAVPCDAHRLERVVVNLLRNAVDAMADRKTGNIRVRTLARDSGGAAIVVQDDGPGVPPEVQPRLFEPFFTTKCKGSGLGLSICAQIIGELGGEILLDSPPGGGATFTINLPPAGAQGPPPAQSGQTT